MDGSELWCKLGKQSGEDLELALEVGSSSWPPLSWLDV